ncbi:MFS transporter [Aeromonas caviae]
MGMFLLCTFLMIILYPLGIDLYLVAVPRIAQTLQGSEAQIHTAFSIYLLGMAATVLPGGMLADRHGRRPVVLGGALIFVVASLVAAEATGIAQFYLGRFWQGVGAGALYIMTFTVLRDVLSQARLAMALSLINGVICVIPVLAPVLGYLILSHFEWRGIFVGMALVAAISALVNLRLLKETRPARQPAGASPLALLGTAPFMLRALLTSASVTAILVYVSVSPLVLMTTFDLSPEQYTRLMMAMAGVSMSASFLTPLLLRWLGKARQGYWRSPISPTCWPCSPCCAAAGPKAACPGCWRGVPWSASGFPAGSGWRWGRRWMCAGIRWHRPVPCSASCR